MAEPQSVVFIHGFMGQGSDWDSVRTQLDDRYPCSGPDVTGETIHEACSGVLESVPPNGAILAGYSMGARLALATAVMHPGSVRALILESGMPGLTSDGERETRIASDRDKAARLRAIGLPAFLQEWYLQPLFASLQQRPELLEPLLARRADLDPERVAEMLCQLSVARQTDYWPALPNLSMPVLALAGALDHKYAAVAERIAARCPMGQCRIIEDAGHNVHLEQPEAYVAAVKLFLNELGDD